MILFSYLQIEKERVSTTLHSFKNQKEHGKHPNNSKQSRIAPKQPKCNQMIEGRKGLETIFDNPNRSEEVWKWKGRTNRWRIEISYNNQVIHLTSKESQNQQNQLQTEVMLGLGSL